MSCFRYVFLALPALPTPVLTADAIGVKVSIAEAEFKPQASAEQDRVPADLEYAIELEARCEPGSEPASLSLGVADTRHHFSLAEATSDAGVSATFVIPGQQLAPVVTQGYCITDDPESQTTRLVAAAFTAQISLLCRSGDAQSMHYSSQPLSLRLVCIAGDAQEAASDSAR